MSANDTTDAGSAGRSREVRIALVLYGGVSLAVYENGVTRAVFDLVKGRGAFDLLLRLLDADAVADVIAGTSAGGINGLLLAAALEAGTEFPETAGLWRKVGDFGALLRPVASADQAISLMDGEDYYQNQLVAAFRKLLADGPADESPGEIDLFITGTNLEGVVTTTWDSLGAHITDKTHRTVFRLQHRPGRKALGIGHTDPQRPVNVELQAAILGSIARITASFPGAFPPFAIEQLPAEQRQPVREALDQLSRSKPAHHVYVDGGVLDNKPFGPVLDAIFYRMPTKIVDRRLFYVEPDPQHLSPASDEESARLQNPLRVAVASLSTIPSHESIAEDLEKLRQHNARIRWLQGLKDDFLHRRAADSLAEATSAAGFDLYRRVRIDHVAKLLVAATDDVPSAQTEILDPARKRLFDGVREFLTKATEPETTGTAKQPGANESPVAGDILTRVIDPYDAAFHLRRAFYVLYQLHANLKQASESERPRLLATIQALGRLIKFLNLIQNRLLLLRDTLLGEQAGATIPGADAVLSGFRALLQADAPPWQAIVAGLQDLVQHRRPLDALADRVAGALGAERLSTSARQAWLWIERHQTGPALQRTQTGGRLNGDGQAIVPTVLTVVADALAHVLNSVANGAELLNRFTLLDRTFFPLEYAARIHELDQIEFVRISPRDAQSGLCAMPPAAKVTGDELAHFAAFFRRDWRSNDILWGRLDGICQLIRSLLDEAAGERLWQERHRLPDCITPEYLEEILPVCPAPIRQSLHAAWIRLAPATGSEQKTDQAAWMCDLRRFRKRLILAAHYQAVGEDLKGVYEDLFYQEMSWGTLDDKTGVGAATNDAVIATRAAVRAEEAMATVTDRGAQFQQLGLGSQTVTGPASAVPVHVLGEYACQTYLLVWGMLTNALGGKRRLVRFFGEWKTRLLFRHPVMFLYQIIWTQRRQPTVFPLLYVGSVTALLACGATGLYFGSFWFLLPIAAALALMAVITWIKPKPKHQ